ncbi:Z1 domain-containing protein [Priestia megaterium]|uniref:Z1 domain-containing protein n=1 Tax=Priestia megaterium TaxID=1404 RepID=UPI00366E1AA1
MLDIIESALNTAFSNGRVNDSDSFHEELKRAIKTASMMGYGEIKEKDVLSHLGQQFSDFLQLHNGTAILQTVNHSNGTVNMNGERWRAYLSYLRKDKKRSNPQLNSMSFTLMNILEHLLKNNEDEYYVNGLIFKDVQSGKTEHFNGLSNLAIDNGYEFIIILAGTQNDLRSQTQIRCDYDILGEKRYHYILEDEDERIVGIGKHRNISMLTTCVTNKLRNGDLNARNGEDALGPRPGEPVVIVTKKNKHTLEALMNLLRNSKAERKKVLIIDDESDLASVDTAFNSKKNRGLLQSEDGYQPSVINASIREILSFLKKRAYVSYTATPFANLLINRQINHPVYGPDLYPKDFIIAIPSEKSYIGPKQWFGKNAVAAPLRNLFDNELPRMFMESAVAGVLHPTLKEAVNVFILSTAVRLIREGEREHCSMLIHTDFRNVNHDTVFPLVDQEIKDLTDLIKVKDEKTLNEFNKLFHEDICLKSKFVTGKDLDISWEKITDMLYTVVKKIKVMKINGQSEDTLNYEEHKNKGLYVVAVGGNKLSRGITLDGLTVSYYLRESRNHDTLTQMGRWSGYKKDYLDVCRLYTTKRLVVAYGSIVESIEKLREDLIEMHDSKLTPDQYQLEIIEETDSICPSIRAIKEAQENLRLQLTASNKSRFTRKSRKRHSLSGAILQETSFYNDPESIKQNKKDVESFITSLQEEPKLIGKYADEVGFNRIWLGVDIDKVVRLLQTFRSPRGRANEAANYITEVQLATQCTELNKCDVVLISNKFALDPGYERLASLPIKRVTRSPRGVDTMLQAVTLKDEQFINLQFKENENLSDGQKIESRKRSTALLLIYPIKTSNLEETEHYDIITFALAFPKSDAVPKANTTYIESTTARNH